MNEFDDDQNDDADLEDERVDPAVPEALTDLFSGSRDEFDASLEMTERFSTHPAQYKLGFHFDDELRAVPESKQDMENFSAVLVAQARLCMEDIVWPVENPETFTNQRTGGKKPALSTQALQEKLVSSLGQAGSLQNVLGNLDQAEIYLSSALEYADSFDCNEGIVVQQWLRFSDVLRLQGDFQEAEEGFRNAIKVILENPSISGFHSFALQHLAKVFFDQKKYSEAAKLFKEALALRTQNSKADLIASSEWGLKRSLELAKKTTE